ncbi:MAG: sigma 54-interacting transcriptional regulator [Myxococcota bacterium]
MATRNARAGTVPAAHTAFPVPRISLHITREGGRDTERVVTVDGTSCRIGSHASNDLVLDDPQVSRLHCLLERTDRGWQIVDRGSLNGTRVNGVAVRDADLPPPSPRIELGRSVLAVVEQIPVAAEDVPVSPGLGDLVGTSIAMRRLFGVVSRVAESEANVLLEGESGTGKEAFAMELVRRSPRKDGPLVIVDCGSIAPTVVESELFGHVRGAFTGAERDRVGAFEEAHQGTIFLDEIGELPIEMQPKLLRAIESGQVRRVGENRTRTVDVRVIAATNRQLDREVNDGRFRDDLYFRLSVVSLRIPALRERPEDIPLLVQYFLSRLGARDRAGMFDAQVTEQLKRHRWPGNVRELRNYVERALVLQNPTAGIQPNPALGATSTGTVDFSQPFGVAKRQLVEDFERRYLIALLQWSGGNISAAARRAGMDRMHLHRLVRRHRLRSTD